MRPGFLAFALLLTPAFLLAAPAVQQVDGPVADGVTVTVHGTGFGAKSPAAPVLFDHVVDQSAYGALADGDPIPTQADGCPGCPWERTLPYGGGVRYTEEDVRTAGGAAYRAVGAGYVALADLGDLAPDRLLVDWWVRTADDLAPEVSHQLIRVRANLDDPEGGVVTWSQRTLVRTVDEDHDGQADQQLPLWRDWGGTPGVWHRLELRLDGRGGAASGFGRVEALVDGDPIHAGDYWAAEPLNDLTVLGLKLAPPDALPAPELSFTDIYVDTTFARVFLNDDPDAAPGSHCELQLPVQWSATSVTFTASLGTFAPDEDLYLFVVDAEGQRSGGFPVDTGEHPGAPGQPSPLEWR